MEKKSAVQLVERKKERMAILLPLGKFHREPAIGGEDLTNFDICIGAFRFYRKNQKVTL